MDVGRNFRSQESILKTLDVMAMYKLNKFYFHLTEDEGWRLEIPGIPELTQVRSREEYFWKLMLICLSTCHLHVHVHVMCML